jgi:valyl-tRNA synthetase
MISGWCLAKDKSKMSKSKGNVVQPQRLLDEKGSDAVRYWASTSKLGADTAYSEDTIKIGKKLITKLWNASKFAAIHLTKVAAKPVSAQADLKAGHISETLDKWIISRLRQTLTEATAAFEKFEYCDARVAVETSSGRTSVTIILS